LLKAFAKGSFVSHADESNPLFAVAHGKQDRTPVRKKKNKTSSSKKMKQRQHKLLELFNYPIRSPVNSQFLKKTSTNTIVHISPGLSIVDTSAWQQFSEPFNPTRLAMVKETADISL
jgi:hypothetical protein